MVLLIVALFVFFSEAFGNLIRNRRNVDRCSKQCPSCVPLDMANTNVDEFTESGNIFTIFNRFEFVQVIVK